MYMYFSTRFFFKIVLIINQFLSFCFCFHFKRNYYLYYNMQFYFCIFIVYFCIVFMYVNTQLSVMSLEFGEELFQNENCASEVT